MAKAAIRGRRSYDTSLDFDPSAIVGLLAAFGLIAAAISSDGSAAAFVNPPAILLVVFGTLAATLISFPFRECLRTPKIIGTALSVRSPPTPKVVARDCLEVANSVRGAGMVAFAYAAERQSEKPILRRGLVMLSDGLKRDTVLASLRTEMLAFGESGDSAQRILRRAAEIAPAMGLIGTLVGLVQMLGQLDDPSAIGPGMAIALLTTLYGAILSHAVLTPLAERLALQCDASMTLMDIELMTVLSLAEDENPRLLETRLNGILPADDQLAMFD